MKILFCSHNFPPHQGGIANFSHGIYESLKSYRFDLCAICDSFKIDKKDRDKDVHYFFNIDIVFLKVIFRTIHVLIAALFFKPDVILISSWKEYGFGALLSKILMNHVYVTQVHGSEIIKIKKNSFQYKLSKSILNNSKYTLANSKYTLRLLDKFNLNNDKLKIFNPGISKNSIEEIIYKNNDEIILFSVCRLIHRKGIDLCIKALSEISLNKNIKWKYFIAGEGPEKESLMNIVKEYKISDKILFLGYVNEKSLNYYYNICDIFILPGRFCEDDIEGFGIVYIEANLHGKPVIGSQIGGVPDAIVNGYNGLMIENENVNELTEKILYLMENPDIRSKLGAQGKCRAETVFEWNNHIKLLINIFKKCK